MVGNEPSPPFEQFCPLFVVDAEVVGQALSGFLDVSSCLVKGQREAVQGLYDVEGCCPICHRGAVKGCIVRDNACSPQLEYCSLFCLDGVELDLAREAPHGLSAGGQQDVTLVPFWQVVTQHGQ